MKDGTPSNVPTKWLLALAIVGALVLAFGAFASNDPPATGAAFTTTNTNVDGTGHCKNGNEDVNCNIYDGKDFVWLNGGPETAYVGDGDYFFAVLSPGGQHDPNDGAENNLSDVSPTSGTGAGDAYSNRTFTVTGGVVTYGGTHTFDSNKIRLMGYDDTTNPGGVYIMAICSLENGYPVTPSRCKYDAFKVKEGDAPTADAPTILKDAEGSYDNTYTWLIDKAVTDATTATIKYEITVTHDGGTISNVTVAGTITVFNPNDDDITGADVTDTLSDSTACSVTGGVDATLSSGPNDFPFTCDLSGLPAGQLDNTAVVDWPEQELGGGTLAAGSADFTFEDIQFAENAIDDCITVVDNKGTPLDTSDDVTLGPVCVGDPNPTVFKYEITLSVTDGQCKTITNTSSFTTDETGATGSDSATVTYCAPATPGYWKQHLASPSQSSPWYDAKCNQKNALPTGTGCSSNGVWTKQYLPKLLGSYAVTTIKQAADVWFVMNCSNTGSDSSSTSTQRNNALGCLGGHLLATKLNLANGSPATACILQAVADADALLIAVSYTGPGNYSITTAQRNLAITIKNKLDKYNNGGGCP